MSLPDPLKRGQRLPLPYRKIAPIEQRGDVMRPRHIASIQDGNGMPWSSTQSLCVQWPLYVVQHADHERQQLLQRLEACLLARHQVLDAAVIGRHAVYWLRAKLHDKGPVSRQSRFG